MMISSRTSFSVAKSSSKEQSRPVSALNVMNESDCLILPGNVAPCTSADPRTLQPVRCVGGARVHLRAPVRNDCRREGGGAGAFSRDTDREAHQVVELRAHA